MGSEIFGNASHVNLKVLDTLEHGCLTYCLGVCRRAHRTEVKIESGIVSLESRRLGKLLKLQRKNIY